MTTEYIISNDTDTIVVNGELSDYPNVTFSEENDFEFFIGGTYSGNVTTSYTTAADRYNRLKEYSNYAGYPATGQTLGGVYFAENTTFDNSNAPSLVVKIKPQSDVEEARSVWGIITSMDDTTEIFGAQARINMSVFVLAEGGDYASETAVRNAFETDI